MTTATVAAVVLTTILVANTPDLTLRLDLSAVVYFGGQTLLLMFPLAVAQGVVGWLVAIRDPFVEGPVADNFVGPVGARWRYSVAAALAAIEDCSTPVLDPSERQLLGELAFDLARDSTLPLALADLGTRRE